MLFSSSYSTISTKWCYRIIDIVPSFTRYCYRVMIIVVHTSSVIWPVSNNGGRTFHSYHLPTMHVVLLYIALAVYQTLQHGCITHAT